MFQRAFLAVAIILLVVGVPTFAGEITVDEIVATHIESLGGLEIMNSIKTTRLEGRLSMGQGMEAPLTIVAARPSSMRLELVFQGMTMVQAYDGETGWQIVPFSGSTEPEAMSGSELEEFADRADFDGPLVGWKEKGSTLELLGTEEVDGTPTHKLLVTTKSGSKTTYFVDTEYCLMIKSQGTTSGHGMEMDVEAFYGDYKEVGGMLMPHSIRQEITGGPMPQTVNLVFETIVPNVEVDMASFKMPAVEEKTADEMDGEGGK